MAIVRVTAPSLGGRGFAARARAAALWRRRRRFVIITISSATILYYYYYYLFYFEQLAHISEHEKIKSKIIDLKRVDEGEQEQEQDNLPTSNATFMKEKELGGSVVDEQKEWKEDTNSDRAVTLNKNNTSPTLCRQVYFWGGGKAGSTSLFFTLVRGPGGLGNPQNTGPFVRDFVKEPCQGSEWNRWETLTKDANVCRSGSGSNSFTHILNGCPRQTYIKYARKAMALSDDPKFLMLVRDPVDRYISFLNDSVRRGGSRMNIEESAKLRSGPGISLVKQGVQLKNLLSVVKDPKQILVIPMESLSLNAEGVIDAIMDHVEGRRWKRNETEVKNPGSMKMNVGSTDKYKYVHLSYNTTEMLRNEFRQDALLLESLVGKRFSWSSWARKDDDSNSAGGNEEQKGEFWLVTSPASG